MVTGHSGSGKSAIVQHIALKYRVEGWTIKPVDTVEEIKKDYESGHFTEGKTIFVLNDSFGKHNFDEIEYQKWVKLEQTIALFLKKVKLFLTCRKSVFKDSELSRNFEERSVVSIDEDELRLSREEKQQILEKYSIGGSNREEKANEILEIDTYFPLLCKLYASQQYRDGNTFILFREPVQFFKKEIESYRKDDKKKYCALACLVFFNNKLCLDDLKKNETCFHDCVKLCGLNDCAQPENIIDTLDLFIGSLVKKIGHTYHFCHDLIMEVTTFVFGTNHCKEIIRHADIGFLKKRLRFDNCTEESDSLTILVEEKYAEEVSNRFYTELFSNQFLEIILNPCLENKRVIKTLIKKLENDSNEMQMLLQKTKLPTWSKLDTNKDCTDLKLAFLNLFSEISPLFALIVFEHNDLSLFCVKTLRKMNIDMTESNLFLAVCSNGFQDLFDMFSKDEVNKSTCLTNESDKIYPFQVSIIFDNVQSLNTLIALGMDVNTKTEYHTPLTFAAEKECEKEHFSRRNNSVKLLLDNGANVNLCLEDSTSPLYIACSNGHDNVVKLLLEYRANVNVCRENGYSPLYIACKNKHESTVKILLENKADVNLYTAEKDNPIFISIQKSLKNVVQLLLKNGAQINSRTNYGASTLFKACERENDEIAKLLLENGVDVNICTYFGASALYLACQNEQESIVQLILENGADANLCLKDGTSPLHIASQNGHNRIVKLLLNKSAMVNKCTINGTTPLHIACQYKRYSTVSILLKKGADVNLCKINGTSALSIARENEQNCIVQLLLNKRPDANICIN